MRLKLKVVGASILFAALVLGLAGLAKHSLNSIPSFDGGLNLNTALAFASGEGYGLFYEQFQLFPIETNGPFIVLAGIPMKYFGVSPFATQAVNLLFAIAFITLSVLVIRAVTSSLIFGVLGGICVLAVPGVLAFGMDGYGELPALTFFLAALYASYIAFVNERHGRILILASGVFIGLSFVTKIIALLWIVPTGMIFAAVSYAGGRSWIRDGVNFCFGALVAVLSWEMFRLVELGGIQQFIDWWGFEFKLILAEGGARTLNSSPGGIVIKGAHHLSILSREVGVAEWQLETFLLLPYPIIIPCFVELIREKQYGRIFVVSAVVVAATLYFVWWLFITPTEAAWLRRILNGLILHQLMVVFALAFLIEKLLYQVESGRRNSMGPLSGALILSSLVVLLQIAVLRTDVWKELWSRSNTKEQFLTLADSIRTLPGDAIIFTTGWWQAPDLALFSGRRFYNFESWTTERMAQLPRKYLVFDAVAQALAPGPFQNILASSTSRVVSQTEAGIVYELTEVAPYPPFSELDRVASGLRSVVDFHHSDYAYTRGLYSREDNVRWSRAESAVMLLRRQEMELVLNISILPGVVVEDGSEPKLDVEVSDCLLRKSVVVKREWRQEVRVKLSCDEFEAPKALIVKLHLNGSMPIPVSMRADQRLLSFLVHVVALE